MLEHEDRREKATVEELLRVKRSEVPTDEFWKGFDRRLEKRIVQSVVRRRSFSQLVGEWFLARGRGVSAAAFLFLGAVLYFSGTNPGDSPAGITNRDSVVAEPVDGADAIPAPSQRAVSAAPSLAVANHDFVIEVLSSEGSVGGGSDLVLADDSERPGRGAYYVADQLSSTDQGWSGERLPF